MSGRQRLIPVQQLATGPAPTAAELRALARRALGLRTEIDAEVRGRPDLLADLDQMFAAEAELTSHVHAAAERSGMRVLEEEAPLHATTVRIAVVIAALRHVEAHCPHAPWPPSPASPHTLVVLAARAAVCRRAGCVEALHSRWHDDGRCELCDRATRSFTPHMAPLGPAVVAVELCGECSRLFDAADVA